MRKVSEVSFGIHESGNPLCSRRLSGNVFFFERGNVSLFLGNLYSRTASASGADKKQRHFLCGFLSADLSSWSTTILCQLDQLEVHLSLRRSIPRDFQLSSDRKKKKIVRTVTIHSFFFFSIYFLFIGEPVWLAVMTVRDNTQKSEDRVDKDA